jgi:hypothetical protein
MPALSADIDAATRPNGVTLDTQEDAGVLATYPTARDGAQAPAVAFWDVLADATALNAERFSLLSAPRRRFKVEADGVLTALLPSAATPAVTLVASEVRANGAFLVARMEFDFGTGRTMLEVWG